MVHLLDLTAPAEAKGMRAMGHLLAQTACIELHAAHHHLRAPPVAAATLPYCQVTPRHDSTADPWKVAAQARGSTGMWQVLKQATPACTAISKVNHLGLQLITERQHCGSTAAALRQHCGSSSPTSKAPAASLAVRIVTS